MAGLVCEAEADKDEKVNRAGYDTERSRTSQLPNVV